MNNKKNSRARLAGQKHEVSGDFHWLPATFDSSVSATQLVHKRFGDLRVPQPYLWVSNSKHVKSFYPTRSFAVRHLTFTVVMLCACVAMHSRSGHAYFMVTLRGYMPII